MINWITSIEEESSSGIREVALRTKHLSNRKIFLNGEITDDTANEFVSMFLYLAQTDEPINIYINSPGGAVNAGLVIYDIIQSCPCPVDMYCVGMAASMAAVILAGGQQGRRYILPHSKVMIHEPLIQGGLGGSASTIHKTAESILETKAIVNGILSQHTGKSIDDVNAATSYDNFMSADEAVSFGIVDRITDNILQNS